MTGGDAARAGVAQGVGDREVAAAHQPEHGVHPHAGERAADRFSDEHRAGDRIQSERVGRRDRGRHTVVVRITLGWIRG
jgi:hypothetical protein